MDKAAMMDKIEQLLDDSKCAVLATIAEENIPRLRWMTPTVLQEEKHTLYAVTSSGFKKVKHLIHNENVCWMVQNKALTEVVTLSGKINIIDNPSLKTKIIEKIGNRLNIFWSLNRDSTDFIILETVIKEATYFQPLKSLKETVQFK
jgi:pyridoxamine 5'-phosphate oxidase